MTFFLTKLKIRLNQKKQIVAMFIEEVALRTVLNIVAGAPSIGIPNRVTLLLRMMSAYLTLDL